MMTNDQVNVIRQSERILYVKLEILNSDLMVIRDITGHLIDGDYKIANESGARRTCNIRLAVDSGVIPSPTSPIWINKIFRAYIGIQNIRTDEVVWFPIGTFAITNPSRDIEVSGKDILSIDGIDFVAFMDGTLGGALDYNIKINTGDYVYNAVKNTIEEFTNFQVNVQSSECKIPHEMEYEKDETVWDLLSDMLELYMHYEGFFDVNGTFIYQKSSDLIDDSVVWDFTEDENNLILDYSIDYQWDNVRNKITVVGKDDDGVYPQYTAVALSTEKGWEDCPFTVDKLGECKAWEYKIPDKWVSTAWEKIQDGSTPALAEIKKQAEENNWDETTAVNNTIGKDIIHFLIGEYGFADLKTKLESYKLDDFATEIQKTDLSYYQSNPRSIVIQENDYWKKEQCVTRAQYELDYRLSGAEKLSLSCVPIYGLDVNQLIKISIPNDPSLDGKYCIDSISCDLGYNGKMSIGCHKVTRNRFSFDQSVLLEQDPTSDNSVIKQVSWNGSVVYLSANKDEFDRRLTLLNDTNLDSIAKKYGLTLREQYELKDIFHFLPKYVGYDGDTIWVDTPEGKQEAMMDSNKNWYTSSYAIGPDLAYKNDWVGTSSTLASYWDKVTRTGTIESSSFVGYECQNYLPYWIVEKWGIDYSQAKSMAWVGMQSAVRTSKAGTFTNKTSKFLMQYQIDNSGGYFTITEKPGTYIKLNKSTDDSTWYTDTTNYGENIFQSQFLYNEELAGNVRIQYEQVMTGKIPLNTI